MFTPFWNNLRTLKCLILSNSSVFMRFLCNVLIVQSILVFCRYFTCEFACSLKCICNTKIKSSQHFHDNSWTCAEQQKMSCLMPVFPAKAERSDPLPSPFGSHILNRFLFISLVPCFLHFCAFCWWFGCLKKKPKRSAQVPSSVPKCKKAVMCLVEKTCVR